MCAALGERYGHRSPEAQPFGNEWINYNQTYFKIKVVNDGIYRIPYATLNAATSQT
jgi:hypothetical protein